MLEALKEVTAVQVPEIQLDRTSVRGKFLYSGTEKVWVKGVTYGTFQPKNGSEEFEPNIVEADFRLMRENSINAVRVYTTPPRWLLDMAQNYGLRLLIGFPWEEHVTFLEDRSTVHSIQDRLKNAVRDVAGHPSVLCYAIGNEIPSSIVRWHGARKIQRFLHRLYQTAKEIDPELPVTYVNYPSTEYLQLPFLDLFCFNIFLESPEEFQSYVLRLQTLASEKPLLLTEIGLDSRSHGLEKQARLLRTQIYSSFVAGCAGAFAYAWTDEWFRGGLDVEDWDFGLTTRDRSPKPALEAVSKQYSKGFLNVKSLPKISVVVCTYNGSRTIEQCLVGLLKLDYPDFEIIVIDDGSSDSTASIVSKYPVRMIQTTNQGLSAARNRGMMEAKGEIIAYIDDDAYPDPHWLSYVAIAFDETTLASIGGPNLVPSEDGFIAQCVAHAAGGPIHVLLSDKEAEHIPGCNMAFRKDALKSIGGFDPQFRIAGDDVDLCWRLKNAGYTIGFHPSALVWHHRRNSIRAYYRQQRGYGKAEVLLARKWPEKYNAAGHVSWAGRVYRNGFLPTGRIYSGVWGTAPFQSLYQHSNGVLSSIFLMPEWILLIWFLFFLAGLGFQWTPLTFAAIFLCFAIFLPFLNAWRTAKRSVDSVYLNGRRHRTFIVSVLLHLIQPFARFVGRWPLWRPQYKHFVFPTEEKISVWNEKWKDHADKLCTILEICKKEGAIICHGGSFDRWDLETKGGAFGIARLLMTVEEHGQGKQMTRFYVYPHTHWLWFTIVCIVMLFSLRAALQSAWFSAAVLLIFSLLFGMRIILESGRAMSALIKAIRLFERKTNE
jgi:GT2 family glycosyltransferase